MELSRSEKLEEKYWKGETTIFEEEELMREFLSGNSDLSKPLQSLLQQKRELENIGTPESFEANFWDEVENREKTISLKKTSFSFLYRAAAVGLIVAFSALLWNVINQESAEPQTAEFVDSFDDPEVAFEETKKALMFASQKLNKAKQPVNEIKRFHETKITISGADEEVLAKD